MPRRLDADRLRAVEEKEMQYNFNKMSQRHPAAYG